MRDFTIDEIKNYSARAQAAVYLRVAVESLEKILDRQLLFSGEENGTINDAYNELNDIEAANNARLEIFEQAMRNFQTTRPSMRALSTLVKLMEGLQDELRQNPTGGPIVPIETDLLSQPPKE